MGALLKRIEGQGFRLRLADGGQVEVRETGSALTDKQVEWIPANKPTLLTELKVRRGATSEQGRLVHYCEICGGDAPFGHGVDLGQWYCREHDKPPHQDREPGDNDGPPDFEAMEQPGYFS
jgi:hypothetical protein